MPEGDIETYFESTEWHSRVTGEDKPFHTADTKERAEAAGRAEAMDRKVEHVIKNQDGSVAERSTYGHDPQGLSQRRYEARHPCGVIEAAGNRPGPGVR